MPDSRSIVIRIAHPGLPKPFPPPPPFPHKMYDKVIGALMVGSWANSSLYIIELMQAYQYYTNYSADHYYIKLTIALCLAVDTLSIAANYGGVYLYSVVHWGDAAYVQNEYWPIYVYCLSTGFTAFVVQSFLIFRYLRATRGYITSVLLFMTSSAALVGAVVTAAIVMQYTTYAQRNHVVAPVTIWLVASASADIALAVTLVWQLRQMQSSFKSTRSIISRLIRSSVQTGTITSIFATIVLITYLTDKESNVTVGIGFCLGRVYTLTFLYNLNNRQSGAAHNNSSGHISGERHANAAPLETLGIHVHRTAIVKIDETENKSEMTEGDRHSERMHKDVF
ncbi:hypothetical protein DFH09DRAFT_1379514 [Mycena vulgaris]|nr:hypothetical protein DFH09DRAFT_1379514 [Mycena vulgaris]